MKVIMIYGSANDMDFMNVGKDYLKKEGVAYEEHVLSAHRNLPELIEFLDGLEKNGDKAVILAIAGLAAALPGVVGVKTSLPCIGVPVPGGPLSGIDALLSISQLPGGVPVTTVGLHSKAPLNACMFAHRILKFAEKVTDTLTSKTLLDEADIATTIRRLAHEILETCREDKPAFVGIHTRGVTLARRVAAVLAEAGHEFPLGTLDISLYRDDLDNLGSTLPKLESSDIPFALEDTRVILFDEVIFTGRTIRAALDGLMDYGRPSKIELAVLVDRGNRELPIQPDYSGIEIDTGRDQYVKVRFHEDDGKEGVFLLQ